VPQLEDCTEQRIFCQHVHTYTILCFVGIYRSHLIEQACQLFIATTSYRQDNLCLFDRGQSAPNQKQLGLRKTCLQPLCLGLLLFFWPRYSIPREWKKYAMQYKKVQKSSWNETYSSSFTKQSCCKMALYRWIRMENRWNIIINYYSSQIPSALPHWLSYKKYISKI